MTWGGGEAHPPGGVQQVQQLPLEGDGQIPVAGAVPEGEAAAGKMPPELFLDLVAHLLHRRGGGAVQGLSLIHI